MLKVTKFGGSSLCDSTAFARVRELVLADPARRVVVVSAPGRRHSADHKLTDLLYLCHAHLQYGVSCWDLWRRVSDRFREIRDGCAVACPIERTLDGIYAALGPDTPQDWLVSRGECLAAMLMAQLLDFTFVDAKDWLLFDAQGRVQKEASYAALRSLADGRKIVTPGFYGAMPGGAIHTLSRGGSDVTGALAAAALHADLYENWTDVPGILAADPRIVPSPAPVAALRYDELQTLAQVGMQVLHESAVAPVAAAQIPLRICSSHEPEKPGTLVSAQLPAQPSAAAVCFAGRRKLAMLRVVSPTAGAAALTDVLRRLDVPLFSVQQACGVTTALLAMPRNAEALHKAQAAVREELHPESCTLRENLSALACLCRQTYAVPAIAGAVEAAGVPVHHMFTAGSCAVLTVNDSQYETALRAAYDARGRMEN